MDDSERRNEGQEYSWGHWENKKNVSWTCYSVAAIKGRREEGEDGDRMHTTQRDRFCKKKRKKGLKFNERKIKHNAWMDPKTADSEEASQ